jgi:hypothetical protein
VEEEEEEDDEYLGRTDWKGRDDQEEEESRGSTVRVVVLRFYRVWRHNTWRRVLTAVLAFLLRGQHGIIWGVI